MHREATVLQHRRRTTALPIALLVRLVLLAAVAHTSLQGESS